MPAFSCVVVFLGLVLGSGGDVLAPSPAAANSPPIQETASSPPEPTFALSPAALPKVPSTPFLASPPLAEKGAPSPTVPNVPQNAPSPVNLPKVEVTPPSPTNEAPPQVAAPPVAIQPPAPTLPASLALPPVQAPSSSTSVKPNQPAVPPSSVNNQTNKPSWSVPQLSTPAFPPARSDVHPDPPKSSFPVITPPTSAPPEFPVEPPMVPPVVAQIPPPQTPAPSSDGNNGKTAPPANVAPPESHKNNHIPHAPPPTETSSQIAPVHKAPVTGSAPATSPVPHGINFPSIQRNSPSHSHAQPPSLAVATRPAPTTTSPARGWTPTKGSTHPSVAPSYPPSHVQGPEVSRAPRQTGTQRQRHHAPPPIFQGHSSFPVQSPSPSTASSSAPSNANKCPNVSPTLPPTVPPQTEPKAPATHPIWALPPPPPNLDCNSLACPEPLTDPPAGAPCVCVLPIKVGIRLGVDLYSFFPLVSNFAEDVASGVNMAQRQVRVMGANVASDQPDKTVVLVNLVPMQVKFDNATAFSTFQSFWNKKITLKPSLFGEYEILYVVYPGLPLSPPSAPENADIDDGAFGNNRNARTMKPLGVDVRRPKRRVNGSLIAIVVLSTLIGLIICTLAAWLLILRYRDSDDMAERFPHSMLPKFSRSFGIGQTQLGGRHSSPSGPSGSLSSSIATYTGQARAFKLVEIEKATNGFDDSKVLGEGGFGCVYQGTLEDGTRVAVKVLKRYDCQGEREFLAEVEMLGRLHHRNLVKLLGICVEENARCLVYELIPNGSVESHLHGVDSETAPFDWNARMKIALGAARGLAYLHEDSSPCVIHRDFKSSNILLEYDFTPKVSDFGLARTARGEGNQHISTRVMGTFGYVAPEYAMTGHLLVKSDVYSYGVVLLELLSGRKPVDMSRPPGQENLVTWARPLLANVVSLREAVDPLLGANVPLDNVAKVAAIASMCVQPEVVHRPSMGEVVQALKLVCSDGDEGLGSGSFSQELVARATAVHNITSLEAERVLLSDMLDPSPVFTPAADLGSFHKQSSSGPLVTGKNRKFWQRLRSLSRGSMSEHSASPEYEMRSQDGER